MGFLMRRSGVKHMKVSVRKRIIAFIMVLILVLSGNSMQISAETKREYKVLLWSTTAGGSGCVTDIKDIYSKLSATGEQNIICVQNMSGTKDNPNHFKGTENLADDYDLIFIILPYIALNENDIKVLRDYVKAGGRLVLQGENDEHFHVENTNLTALAEALGTSFRITTHSIKDRVVADVNLNSDLLGGVPLKDGDVERR